MGQISDFSNNRHLDTDEGGFESIGAVAGLVVERLRAKLGPAHIMVTIPVTPDILANIDHEAMWSGLDRAELLRRCVTAAYIR